jgi:signal transduction histidine kinase
MSSKKSSQLGLTFSLKQSLAYALFFSVASVALFGAVYYTVHGMVMRGEREVVEARIREYRAWYAEGGLAALQRRFYDRSDMTRDIYFVRVVGPGNAALFVSIPRGVGSVDLAQINLAQEARLQPWYNVLLGRGPENTWTVGSATLTQGLTLQVGKSSTQAQLIMRQLGRVFLVFILPVFILGVAGGALLTFRAMSPLRRIIATVRDILQTGKTSKRVEGPAGRGEMGALVELFNRMLEKNDSLIAAMRNSLDSVAHDFRTPMTRLRTEAEFALANPKDSGAVLEALATCLEESERMLTMLDTLMDVAEAQTGAMRLSLGQVDLCAVARSVADLYEILADERGMTLKLDLPDEPVWALADENRVKQAAANLVDNAVKYSPDGSEVTITVFADEKGAALSVADQGPGIPPWEREKIWERLYRGDQSRSKRGLGLGLSLVRAVAMAHSGQALVESEPGRGSVFTLYLPAFA